MRRGKELRDGWEESDYQVHFLLAENLSKLNYSPSPFEQHKEVIQHLPFWFPSPIIWWRSIGSLEIKFLLCPAGAQSFLQSANAVVLFPERSWAFKILPPSSPGLKKKPNQTAFPFIRQNTLSSSILQNPSISMHQKQHSLCWYQMKQGLNTQHI